MAAHVSSSSSEDEDEKERLKEAVFEVTPCKEPSSSLSRDGSDRRCPSKKSLRTGQHEEEESSSTGISGEVRDFVAKKLSSFLDSCITESDTDHFNTGVTRADGESDRGFRLFSGSNPATEVKLSAETPPPRRRKRVESSSSGDSDSDEEKYRLAAAAVSHQDILKSSAPLQAVQTHTCSAAATAQDKVPPGSVTTVSSRLSDQPVQKKKKKHKEKSAERTQGTCRAGDSFEKKQVEKELKQESKDLMVEQPVQKKRKHNEKSTERMEGTCRAGDDSEQKQGEKELKQESKDLMVEKSTLCQSQQVSENGCSKGESGKTKTLISEKHHKKKKRKKKAGDS